MREDELGEPIVRLLRLVGDISSEDEALIRLVSVHDMSVIHAQLEYQQTPPSKLWLKLRQTLLNRKEKMDGLLETLTTKIERTSERKERREQEYKDAVAKHASASKKIKDQIEKNEKALERDRDDISDAEYEEKKDELNRQRQEATDQEKEQKELLDKEYLADRMEIDKKMNEMKEKIESTNGPKESQKVLWNKYAEKLVSSSTPVKSVDDPELTEFAPLISKNTSEPGGTPFIPKCENCGAVFDKPPPDWFCPTCLSKRHRQRVWQVEEDSIRCMICLDAPIARFSRHHCRNCGRLVCSRCCSQRVVLSELGYKGPEKVCDECCTRLGVSIPEKKTW